MILNTNRKTELQVVDEGQKEDVISKTYVKGAFKGNVFLYICCICCLLYLVLHLPKNCVIHCVYLSVCLQKNSKNYKWIFSELSGNVDNGTRDR